MTDSAPETAETTVEAPKASNDPRPCECSFFEVLVNFRDNPEEGGEPLYDDVVTTGCTSTTRKMFAPGHDAKLKSLLIKYGALDEEIYRLEGSVRVSASADNWATRYGFTDQVCSGIDKAVARRRAAADRLRKREEKRQAAVDAKAALKKERQTLAKLVLTDDSGSPLVVAQVDGSRYLGHVSDSPEFGQRFTYTDADGVSQTVADFTVVTGDEQQ